MIHEKKTIVKSPLVAVLVLNWNGWQDTLGCLESLRKLSIVNCQLSILVVDNGSTDGSSDKIEEYIRVNPRLDPRLSASITLIKNKDNLGFAGGNNVGIRYALEHDADYICLLNNDTIVAPDFLEKLVAVGERHQDLGMLNSKILLLNAAKSHIAYRISQSVTNEVDDKRYAISDKPRFWWIGGKINWMRTKGEHLHYAEEDKGQFDREEYIETDYCTGCCLLIKRKVIEKIGLMPEEYFLYYEDAEWSLKARKAGFRCAVVPSAVIWHQGAASTKEGSPTYIRYHVRNGLMLALRTGNLWQILAAYLFTIPRAKWQVVKWLLFPSKRVWAKAILLGIWDAWQGRAGKL